MNTVEGSVSYTHLDVYKRQGLHDTVSVVAALAENGIMRAIIITARTAAKIFFVVFIFLSPLCEHICEAEQSRTFQRHQP